MRAPHPVGAGATRPRALQPRRIMWNGADAHSLIVSGPSYGNVEAKMSKLAITKGLSTWG
jgi:hypothetical protein